MNQIKELSFQQSKHLVERTGLGTELNVIQSFVGKSLDAFLNEALNSPALNDKSPPDLLQPSEMLKVRRGYRKNNERQKIGKLFRKERDVFQIWGLQRLLTSEKPLHERMVWFWHNHFTSSIKNVRTVSWMFQQDSSIRENATGNFSELLTSMTFDPAMLIYLDGRSNKKDEPNENFARELLELFTLGEGHYTELDIKEAARAFTGWIVSEKKDKAVFQKKQHDSGLKSFMGKKGEFTANDILKILLDNPRTAEFIAEKLWYEFVSIQPAEPAVIKSWSTIFRNSDYDISLLLETVFKSDSFWDEKYRGTLIKSPIDLVVGTLRTLDLEDFDTSSKTYIRQMSLMGQDLYTPPNVKGWEGGKAWIDDDTLLRRQRFLKRILRGQTGVKKKQDSNMSSQSMEKTLPSDSMEASAMLKTSSQNLSKNLSKNSKYEIPDLSEKQWSDWLLAIPAVLPIDKKTKRARLAAILLDPAYQLK